MKLHHVGYVVRDIDAAAAGFPGLQFVHQVHDPLQHADLALYAAGGSHIEFIQPLSPQAFTWGALERHGDAPHHVCYEGIAACDIDALLAKHRMLKLRGPMPAVLFGRDVLFAMTRQRSIVEFLL